MRLGMPERGSGMTWNSDSQKEEIIAQRKREMLEAVREAEAMDPAETLRKRRETGFAPLDTLAGQFQSIMEAPDYSPSLRRVLLMEWAHRNRAQIERALSD